MKRAAKRVVNTLSAGDFFTVIQFNNQASILGNDWMMVRATDKNKAAFDGYINNLSPGGGTYFQNGFDLAFKTFDRSANQDRSSGCNKAILFLTDGILSDDEKELYRQIQEERVKYENKGRNPPTLFTYSFGSGADDIVPKQIACQNDGIWSQIDDGGDLAKSMGAYYKYFAYGLGSGNNEDFVAWVEPYEYSTGVGLGTTASAPVFDRTVEPPVLAGVVGQDVSFAALEKAFGEMNSSQRTIIDKIIQRSGAVCPKIELSACQLESLRKYGSDDRGNDKALCNHCVEGTISPLQAPLCDKYATELWDNESNKGRSYEKRTCCHVGSEPCIKNTLSDEEVEEAVCTEKHPNLGLILGLSIPLGIIACFCFAVVVARVRLKMENRNTYAISSFDNSIAILPPPSAPHR